MREIDVAIGELGNLLKEMSDGKYSLDKVREKVQEHLRERGANLPKKEFEELVEGVSATYKEFLSNKISEIRKQQEELVDLGRAFYANS